MEIAYPDELEWSPLPFSGSWGISTSFFKVAAWEAKSGKRDQAVTVSVPQRAQEIAEAIAEAVGTPDGFESSEAVRGYLNFSYSTAEFSRRVLSQILTEGSGYGCAEANREIVMVEFSQPNTHKAFHVGHLRNVILGESLSRILECAGYEVVRANYIGDIGLHVIKWLWNYQNNHAGEQPGPDKTRWMGDLYSEAEQRSEGSQEAEGEIRALFARWDKREPEVVALWEQTRQWSLDGFNQIYDMLGVAFDRFYFESEEEDPGKALVEEMINKNLAVDERPDGPVIIRLDDLVDPEKDEYRVLVLLRSDSTSLYATKDLPLAIRKFEEYPLARSIYVIDVRQSFYMKQIYKTLELMGYPWADRLYHFPYEIVNLPGNVTMSSREGTVVLLEDLVREANARALEIVQEKNPELEEEVKAGVAQAVGLAAIKFPMLARENTKKVTFDWQAALDFEGQAAPYIQYAGVRAGSILRRHPTDIPALPETLPKLEPAEIQLVDELSRYPAEIQRAGKELKTLHISNYAYGLARAFNDFYNQCPVLQAEPDVQAFRLHLVAAAKITLTNALETLGIDSPEVM
ncbi:MAG: arginine--tRNA ligase [Anaerolineales bacterium]|nr:arginine--tRNA ligase [Anaerolineales bacterium]